MKLLYAAIVLTAIAVKANAQIAPIAPQRVTPDYKIPGLMQDKGTDQFKLTTPNNSNYLKDGLGSLQIVSPQNETAFTIPNNTEVIYSRMPVAHLQGSDNMPVAVTKATNYTMLVKRLTVIDPLAPVAVNP